MPHSVGAGANGLEGIAGSNEEAFRLRDMLEGVFLEFDRITEHD